MATVNKTGKRKTMVREKQDADEARSLLCEIVAFLEEKKGEEIVILDISEVNPYFHYFIIATASSGLHLRSLATQLKKQFAHRLMQKKSVGAENLDSGWVVVDFIDPVLHLFLKEEREFYNLERLWGDAKRIDPGELMAGWSKPSDAD